MNKLFYKTIISLSMLAVIPGCMLSHYDFGSGGGNENATANVWISVSDLNNAKIRSKYVGKFFSMNLVYKGISDRVKKPNSLLAGSDDYLLRLCEVKNTSICSNKFFVNWYDNETIDQLKRYKKVTIKGTLVGVTNATDIGISKSHTGSYDHVLISEVHPYSPQNLSRNNNQGYSTADIKFIQQKLNQSGFDAGTVDGVLGNKTTMAIIAFQKSQGLTPDGLVGPKTMAAFKKVENNSGNSGSQAKVSDVLNEQSKEDIESPTIIESSTIEVINDTSLKSEPDLFSATLMLIKNGEKLDVVSQDGDWYEVRHLNKKGYILSSDTKLQ